MSTYQSILLYVLAGLLAAAAWRSLRAFWALTIAVRDLTAEKAERDRQVSVVLEELDLRIRRLLARENYWRGIAGKNAQLPEEPVAEDAKETPLEARRRMRGY